MISSFNGAKDASLTWILSIKTCLEKNGMLQHFIENTLPFTTNIYLKFHQRLADQFCHGAFTEINNPTSKLRTYGLIKDTIGLDHYLT